jgi:tetratricopeptide (TPR) repeat protein
VATVVDHVRLFRNRPDLRWEHRVHEQILPAVRRVRAEVRWADVVIQHTGYQDAEVRARKLQRDLRLLHLEYEEQPDDPFTLFNLGSVMQEQARPAEALPLLYRSLARSRPRDSIVRKLYALLARCHRQLHQSAQALEVCRRGRVYYPADAELQFVEGEVLCDQGDLAGAESCFLRLVAGGEGGHFASVAAGLRGVTGRARLAGVYQEQGRADDAEAQWRAVLARQPDFLPAWQGLADLYLAHSRWTELDGVISRLAALPGAETETAVVRARAQLARREFEPARATLEAAIAQAPRALRPRVILSHVLLQEGRDGVAAENALREVLALDANHAEAQRNLAILRGRRQGAQANGRV